MRASDADRDASARVLATALSEGRLDLEEYDQRLSTAMRAGTIGELAALTADLPAPEPAAPPAPAAGASAPERRGARLAEELRSLAGGTVIMTGIWGVTSAVTNDFLPFWPVIPIGIWLSVILASVITSDRPRRGGC